MLVGLAVGTQALGSSNLSRMSKVCHALAQGITGSILRLSPRSLVPFKTKQISSEGRNSVFGLVPSRVRLSAAEGAALSLVEGEMALMQSWGLLCHDCVLEQP